MPGAAVATTSSTPLRCRRLRQPAQAALVQVVDQRLLGGDGARPITPATAGRRPGAGRARRSRARRQPNSRRQAARPSTSTTRVRNPQVAAAHGEGSRYRRLADPALPGHDDEPGGSEELLWIHDPPRRRFVRRLPMTTFAPAPITRRAGPCSRCPWWSGARSAARPATRGRRVGAAARRRRRGERAPRPAGGRQHRAGHRPGRLGRCPGPRAAAELEAARRVSRARDGRAGRADRRLAGAGRHLGRARPARVPTG